MKKSNSRHERQTEATRFSNYHILIYTSETCKYLKATNELNKLDAENKEKEKKEQTKQHNSDQLFKAVIKYSEVAYPLSESKQWKAPLLNTSIFDINREHKATLKVKIPTQLL